MTSWIQPHTDGCVLSLHIQPRARKNQIQGIHGESLKVRVNAPPVDGEANECLLRFLAKTLEISASRLQILHGHLGREKRVLVQGLSTEEAISKLLP